MSDFDRSMHGSHLVTSLQTQIIVGGAAGNHTVTGIGLNDDLLYVAMLGFNTADPVVAGGAVTPVVSNLTNEFTVTAANTINNGGGTASTNRVLLVIYNHVHPNS